MKKSKTTLAVLIGALFSSEIALAQQKTGDDVQTIEVVGRRQSGSYSAGEVSGTKSELTIAELPQAVRVMSRQTLDDLGAVRLDDSLDYVGGVSRQNNFGGLWDNIAIRGLAGDINTGMTLLQNGFSGNRGFNAPRDTANVERIEFLKGSAASLYGRSEPGGTLNLVTKKPLWRPGHSVEAYSGSFDFYRLSADMTGPITPDFAYRLNVAVENRGSFRDHVTTRRRLVAPAFSLRISRDTRLDYSGEWLRHETPLDRGVVAINNQLDAIPRSRFLGEPADGNVVVENQTHQFVLGRVLSPDWTGNIALSYKGGTLKGFSSEAQAALQRDNVTLRRQRRFRDYTSDDLTLQGELTGKFNVGATEHELLVGSEAYRFKIDQLMLRVNPTNAAPYAISVTAPVYGQAQPTPTANTNTNEVQNNLAFYVQDTMKLGERWRVLSGLRHDKASQEVLNRLTSLKTSQSMGATSPKIGLSYLPSKVLTLYANTGKSFRPNTGTNSSSTAFDSEVGYAKEMGLKWESMDKSLGGTFALFDIRKQNVLTTDPANANFQVATGEVRSRGFDADLSGQMNRNWRINTSITVNDATVVRDNSLEVGGRLLNVPRVNGSLLLVYEAMLNDSRYGLGGGVTYTGRRLGQARTQTQVNAGTAAFELPQYTTAKVLAYWRMSPSVRFSLDIDNVFDKTYYTNSFQSTWVGVGAPRTVTLGVQAKF